MPNAKTTKQEKRVKVQVTLSFSGWVTVRMTQKQADELLASIDRRETIDPGDVPGFDWDNALNQLGVEVEDAEVMVDGD